MCSDDNSWTNGEMTCRDYSLVESNCDDIGSDGRSALDACKVACDNCSTYKEITRRLPSPVEDTEEPSYAQFEGEDGGEFGGAGGIDTREILGKLDSIDDRLDLMGGIVGGVGETVTDSLQFTLDSLRGDNDKYRQLQLLDSDQSGSISLDELLARISVGSTSAGGSSDYDAIRGNITLLSSNLKQRLVTFCEKTLLPLAENIKGNADLTTATDADIDPVIQDVRDQIGIINGVLDPTLEDLYDYIDIIVAVYENLEIGLGLALRPPYDAINVGIVATHLSLEAISVSSRNYESAAENPIRLIGEAFAITDEARNQDRDDLRDGISKDAIMEKLTSIINAQPEGITGLSVLSDMIPAEKEAATIAAATELYNYFDADGASDSDKFANIDARWHLFQEMWKWRATALNASLGGMIAVSRDFNIFTDKVRGLQNQLVTDLIGTVNPPPGPGPGAAAPGAGAAAPGAAAPGAAATGAGVPAAAADDAAATPLPEDDDGIGALEIGAGIGIAVGAATLAWFLFGGGDKSPAIHSDYVRF